MNRIVNKEHFSEKVFKLEIDAPLIAKSRKAGHFVIVRVGEKGERMPLTIAGADIAKGTITLVVQEVDYHQRGCANSTWETILQMW
jgi:glutamate synthase (NADPH/NADH) small chain